MDFFSDTLRIPEETFKAAFSFYSGQYPVIYREAWASGACSGIAVGVNLTDWNSKFFNSGYLSFDGKSIVRFSNSGSQFNRNLPLEDASIFLSFERKRQGNEVLLSSINGSSSLFSGYCLGINDANKLYLKYWNSVDGGFTLTSSLNLSKKNLIYLNKDGSNVTVGRFNNNTLAFENESFSIYRNNFIESNDLVLGGYYAESDPSFLNKNRAPWAFDGALNFSGVIDKFYFVYNMPSVYQNLLVSGIFAKSTGVDGYTETLCYETGFFQETGEYIYTKTGVFASGYVSGSVEITGYTPFQSGYTYFGLVGYQDVLVRTYEDQCKITHNVFEKRPVSGFITDYVTVQLPVYGTIFKSGTIDIDLSGFVFQSEVVPITQTICDDNFIITGDVFFSWDTGYLASLSYDKYYFPQNNNSFLWLNNLEIYAKPYTLETFRYNKNAFYGELDGNYWIDESVYSDSKYFEFFSAGKHLFQTGYSVILDGYEEKIVPSGDYLLSGEILYPGSSILNNDKNNLFYDYQETPASEQRLNRYTYVFTPEFRSRIFTGANLDRAFIYRNGIKMRDTGSFSPQYEVESWPDSGAATAPITIFQSGYPFNDYIQWEKISYGNDVFVCAPVNFGFNRIAVSQDGINWSGVRTFPSGFSNLSYNALNFANDKFILFRGTSATYSFDGINWLTGTFPAGNPAVPAAGAIDWSQIAYGKNKYIVYSREITSSYGMTSINGINWSYASNRPPVKYLNKLIYIGDNVNGRFLGVCGENALNQKESVVISSSDGNTWSLSTFMPTSAAWIDIAHGNSKTIAIGKNDAVGVAAISTNSGSSWSSLTSLSGNWNSITYASGVFVALNNLSGAYSYEGLNWNIYPLLDITPARGAAPSTFNEHKNVAFGKGRFVSLDRYTRDTPPLQTSMTGIYFDLNQSITLFSDINNVQTLFTYKDYGYMYKLPQGSITHTEKFNNLCSHAYYNGLRQDLGRDYIEVSSFDLLSGYLETPAERNIIYNIAQGFLNI